MLLEFVVEFVEFADSEGTVLKRDASDEDEVFDKASKGWMGFFLLKAIVFGRFSDIRSLNT